MIVHIRNLGKRRVREDKSIPGHYLWQGPFGGWVHCTLEENRQVIAQLT